MTNVLEVGNFKPPERPKYTRYELAKLVRNKREKLGLTVESVAAQYNVDEKLIQSIENASRIFNVRMYKVICEFLDMSKEEILSKEVDDMTAISFRSKGDSDKIRETVQMANAIFDEIIMQEKIGIDL